MFLYANVSYSSLNNRAPLLKCFCTNVSYSGLNNRAPLLKCFCTNVSYSSLNNRVPTLIFSSASQSMAILGEDGLRW